ncbi:MAG: hypothetical protein NTW87_15795 [Planctomycetota bacterium]|nr:hypothetical protein [Planctomycetota bacterium]
MRHAMLGVVTALVVLAVGMAAAAEERKDMRVLFDFEDVNEVGELKAYADNLAFDVVQDNGVTRGKNCCRLVGKQGADFALFELRGEKMKGWGNYDYLAVDVFYDRDAKLPFVFELWDGMSKNYHTRCTFEDSQLHKGRNTLLWRINRARRNGKEGRDWSELEPQDKIQMNGLTKAKFFFAPFKDGGDTVLWLDNLRLMQADAVGGKLEIKIPDGAKAFDCGAKAQLVRGFTHAGPETAWDEKAGFGFTGENLLVTGKAWPDPLTGDGVAAKSGSFRFDVAVPDGEYCVWLSAAKILDAGRMGDPYVLKVGDKTLCDEKVTPREFYGDKYLYRHMRTQYSERPNALWLDYVDPVCPGLALKAQAAGGKLTVTASNHRLSGLIVMPAKDEAAFNALAEEIKAQRTKYFYNSLYLDPHEKPKKADGDGAYVLWTPAAATAVSPWTGPSEKERAAKSVKLLAAPGQRVVARLCVTAFEDLGKGDIAVSDLKGPGEIAASSIRRYHQNYRVTGTSVGEMGLMPWTSIRFEPAITWAYWLWLKVPDDAKPGAYTGTVTFTPEKGGKKEFPVELEVCPIKLLDNLPLSLGMYYGLWSFPPGIDRRKMAVEQHTFMREIGFTGTCVGSGNLTGMQGRDKVTVTFDPLLFEIAKEVGMGRTPEQYSMGNTLGMARAVARRLGSKVDQNPGCEMSKPELKAYYLDAIRQYQAFIEKTGLPVAVEVVDEPREVPNPWNRNLEHTCTYADWIHEAAANLKTFVTPMGDSQSGKDYTSLVDHIDIVSVHAYAGSKKMIEATQAKNKTLWFYNTGMDRFSWGFYAWRMGAKGRWEWHWCFVDEGGPEGYPCPAEWYTPFTANDAFTTQAPCFEFPGGMLFKSNYLSVSEGINDYAYLLALEKAIASTTGVSPVAGSTGVSPVVAAEAKKFLDALKAAIPTFPGVKGLASADAGALVGAGLDTPAAENADMWRRKLAEFLVKLATK